jgi:hypothetical protein
LQQPGESKQLVVTLQVPVLVSQVRTVHGGSISKLWQQASLVQKNSLLQVPSGLQTPFWHGSAMPWQQLSSPL